MSEDNSPTDSVESSTSRCSLDPGSKMLDLGFDHHSPVDAWHSLIANPSHLSVAIHEITHFQSLINPVGCVFTARTFFQYFFYSQMIGYAKGNHPGIEKVALLYVHEFFESNLMRELWRPLLEGIALYAQTSIPCREGIISKPADSLLTYAMMLRMLDPEVNDDSFNGANAAIQDAIAGAAESDAGGLPLAARLELDGGSDHLPYFLGHAYVRAVQSRFRNAVPELDCPELFTNFLLKFLQGSARRTLLGRGVRPSDQEAVTRLYTWVSQLDQASPNLMRQLVTLPASADIADALLVQDADEPMVEQWVSVNDVTRYMPDLLPAEWRFFTGMLSTLPSSMLDESTAQFAEKLGFEAAADETFGSLLAESEFTDYASMFGTTFLSTYVRSTLWMNMSSRGECRLVGRLADQPVDYVTCLLDVSGHRWQVRLTPEDARTLGLELGGLPIIGKGEESSSHEQTHIRGFNLEMDSFLQPDAEWPFVVELRPANGNIRRILLRAEMDPLNQRLVLSPVDRRSQESYFAAQSLRADLETACNINRAASVLKNLGLKRLADGIVENRATLNASLTKLRLRWSHSILEQLLGAEMCEANYQDVTANALSSSLLTIVPKLIASAYSSPSVFMGPGAEDNLAILEAVNRDALTRYGKRLFELRPDKVVRYLGLWEP